MEGRGQAERPDLTGSVHLLQKRKIGEEHDRGGREKRSSRYKNSAIFSGSCHPRFGCTGSNFLPQPFPFPSVPSLRTMSCGAHCKSKIKLHCTSALVLTIIFEGFRSLCIIQLLQHKKITMKLKYR